jgi:hypothetical protein
VRIGILVGCSVDVVVDTNQNCELAWHNVVGLHIFSVNNPFVLQFKSLLAPLTCSLT